MTSPAAGPLLSVAALRQDLRFAARMFIKSPLFTTIVVVTLALGIGLNTAVFSAVDALLLRPLPVVRKSSELVQIYRTAPGGEVYNSNSIPHYFDVRNRTTKVFSGVAAWSFQFINITADGRPLNVAAEMVSANYFAVLGVNAWKGRTFTPDEDIGQGAHPVAVLSYGAWQSLFGADANVVGRTIPVNGQAMTIVGIAPPGFRGALPVVQPVMWVPLTQVGQIRPGSANEFIERGNNYNDIIARLAPGVTVEQARARLNAVAKELQDEFPVEYKDRGINMIRQVDAGMHPTLRGAQVGLSAVVMTVVAILLVIACVNVANLFLARARDRAREMAIRIALGARRAALIRQLLVESLFYAFTAGAIGMLIALWSIRIANSIRLPMNVDFSPELRLSPLVLTFALAITTLTGMVFGLAPALQATRPSLIPALKGEAPAGNSRSRTTKSLVVAQMALSMILLVCAALFLLNLRSATAIDKGFSTTSALLVDLDPGLQGYPRERTTEFYRQLMERLRANPSVQSVGIIENMPLGLSSSDRGVEIPGYTKLPDENMSIYYSRTSPGYFATMGIKLLEGREFTAQDDSAAPRVLVVNEQFAKRFWPGQSALGRVVHTGGRDYTVAGVVATGKYKRLGEDPTAFMYFSQLQQWTTGMTVVIRTVGDPSLFIPTLRREIAALDRDLPLSNVRTLDVQLGLSLLPARIAGIALGVFGALGLLLASVGMYGVMAYSVAQRTREIGIRMAIGASAQSVVQLIMRQGLSLVMVGSAIGLAGAIAASRLLRSVLYGTDAINPLTFLIVPIVLISVSALATFVPARRAALVDPTISMRAD